MFGESFYSGITLDMSYFPERFENLSISEINEKFNKNIKIKESYYDYLEYTEGKEYSDKVRKLNQQLGLNLCNVPD